MKYRSLKRVRKSWHYRKLFKRGRYYKGKVLKARYLRNTLGQIRLGFSVSAKTGNAVKRNRFKRRLRQYSVETEPKTGFDAVIFPLVKLDRITWKQMKEDMDMLAEAAEEITDG